MIALGVAFAGSLDFAVPASPLTHDNFTGFSTEIGQPEQPEVVIEDGAYRVSCATTDGVTSVRVTTLSERTPKPTTFTCGAEKPLKIRLIPAFDQRDDPSDGVRIVRRTQHTAAFFATTLPDAQGSMPGGMCAVANGALTVTYLRGRQGDVCTLDLPTGPLAIPITLVRSTADL